MKLRTLMSAALAMAVAASAFAQEDLKVGDNAPGLDIKTWLGPKSQPVPNGISIESGKVYVVEFWATWCPPCRKSIPHLSALQNTYKDDGLTIIGVSTEEESVVKKFVKSNSSKFDYTVAVDRTQNTSRAWMMAANQNGIPCAFIVDRQGKVAFIGHPLDNSFEDTLKKVMSGRYDPKLARRAEPVINAARQARKVQNWALASRHYDEVVALDSNIFATIAIEKFDMLLQDMNDQARAYEYARRELLEKSFVSDAEAIQMLVEKVVLDPKVDKAKRDLDFALEAAEASRRIAGEQDANALASLALVRYHRGEIDHAIDLQKQAYFNALPKQKPEYRRTLSSYQAAGVKSASLNSKN